MNERLQAQRQREQSESRRRITELLFTQRLYRLIELRQQHCSQGATDLGSALISKAIYSTYRDLVGLGLRERARRMLTDPEKT